MIKLIVKYKKQVWKGQNYEDELCCSILEFSDKKHISNNSIREKLPSCSTVFDITEINNQDKPITKKP